MTIILRTSYNNADHGNLDPSTHIGRCFSSARIASFNLMSYLSKNKQLKSMNPGSYNLHLYNQRKTSRTMGDTTKSQNHEEHQTHTCLNFTVCEIAS